MIYVNNVISIYLDIYFCSGIYSETLQTYVVMGKNNIPARLCRIYLYVYVVIYNISDMHTGMCSLMWSQPRKALRNVRFAVKCRQAAVMRQVSMAV